MQRRTPAGGLVLRRPRLGGYAYWIFNVISYLGEFVEEDYFFATGGGTHVVGIPFAIGN
jgi:hypothetical protein